LVNRLRGYTGKSEEKFWETTKKLHKVPSGQLQTLLNSVEKNIGKYDLKYGKHKFLVLLERYAKRLNSTTRCLKEIQVEIERMEQEIMEEVWKKPVDETKMLISEAIYESQLPSAIPKRAVDRKSDCKSSVLSTRQKIQKDIDKCKRAQEEMKQLVDKQFEDANNLLKEKKDIEQAIEIAYQKKCDKVTVDKLEKALGEVNKKILNLEYSTKELKLVKDAKVKELKKMSQYNQTIKENMKKPEVQRVINGIAKLSRADTKREAIQEAHKLKKKLNL